MATTYYSKDFKKMAVELVCISKNSTLKTAKDLNVPIKTFEKWITAYNKDNNVFNENYISPEQQILSIKKRVTELEKTNDILKKTLGFYIKNEK